MKTPTRKPRAAARKKRFKAMLEKVNRKYGRALKRLAN
jgi:hypothetical protein